MIVVLGAVGIFFVLALIRPGFYPTFDEQKYLGIGYNLWAGRGITTVFGDLFISHSPLWSAVLAAPDVTLGIDPWAWGRLLNAISGAAVVGLGGALGWRVRPAVGALAAVGIMAVPYLHDLSRTARLDVPAAALALLYIVVGFEAVRRGSTRWAIAAGAIFAIGFLVKEIALPFAPIPFIAGILWGRSWVVLARLAAWVLLTASIGLSWWFAVYATLAHRVYRLDSPTWTLIPLTVGIVLAVVVGLSASRFARSSAGLRIANRADAVTPGFWRRHGRAVVAWGLAFAWFALLTLVFARTSRLKGSSILDLEQMRLYAGMWLNQFRWAVLLAASAIVLALVALVRLRDRAQRQAIVDLLVASICSAPLVLLVVAVGEPPRNYLAQLAIAAAIAAVGIIWAVERLATLVVRSGRGEPDRVRSLAVATTLIVALVVAGGSLAFHVSRTNPAVNGRDLAVSTVSEWLLDNVPPGAKVAFPSFLGYEMALGLRGHTDNVTVRARIAIADPTAPEGLIRAGEKQAADWIAVDTAPRNVNEYQAFRADWLQRQLGQDGVEYWVYSTGVPTAAGSIIPALASSTGIEQVAHWTFPVAGQNPIDSYVFKIDPTLVTFDVGKLYIAPDALDRLVTRLEAEATPPVGVARTLLERVVLTQSSPLADAALTRLRALAGD
jgi:4-amino-4-deoxy-L-arabinose transferase-like glycosyltransferase